MQPRRYRLIVFLILVPLLVTLLTKLYSSPRIHRRVQILEWKLSGSIPYISWVQVYKALLPSRLKDPVPPQSSDVVKAIAHDDGPCSVLWSTPYGSFWGQANDDKTLSDLAHLDRYQRSVVKIRSGDVVIDIGSQLGTFTRIALKNGAQQVVAIEPDAGDNICFKKTFESEIRGGKVALLEAALWDTSGSVPFSVSSRSDLGTIAFQFNPEWGLVRTVQVPAITLDDAVERMNLSHVDFIKWAIGGEVLKRALASSGRTLARFRPRMVMWIDVDPAGIPSVALKAVPTYHIFTHDFELAYFY
jgi:FkbM family methyltransferase